MNAFVVVRISTSRRRRARKKGKMIPYILLCLNLIWFETVLNMLRIANFSFDGLVFLFFRNSVVLVGVKL
jgi:hypothetical protein